MRRKLQGKQILYRSLNPFLHGLQMYTFRTVLFMQHCAEMKSEVSSFYLKKTSKCLYDPLKGELKLAEAVVQVGLPHCYGC